MTTRNDIVDHVLSSLDVNHVRGCAEAAAHAIDDPDCPAFEVVYQPGDMTNYTLLFTSLDKRWPVLSAFGGGTGDCPPISHLGVHVGSGYYAVHYIENGRAAIFRRGTYVMWEEVVSKLTDNEASALALACLLNEIHGIDGYRDRFYREEEEA